MGQDIKQYPIHLGLGATAVIEPEFTGMEWYADYINRQQSDGKEGRLVSMYTLDKSWDSWEMHPVDVESEATALFITAGVGTKHRQRN